MFNNLSTVKYAMHVRVEEKFVATAKLWLSQCRQLKWYSTKALLKLDNNVDEMIENENLQHRNHPGIIRPKFVDHPKWLVTAIRSIFKEQAICKQDAYKHADLLYAHLFHRHAPVEGMSLNTQLQKIKTRLEERNIDFKFETSHDLQKDPKVKRIAQEFLYNWSAMDYNKYNSLLYLIARSVQDYAVLCKIFREIHHRDKEFKPQSLFDFGSGTGTVLWATSKYWMESLKEHYCVDVSESMNNLCNTILKMSDIQIKGLFHRQFFPVDTSTTFDIVVSAYSLFELPSQKARLNTILKLWKRTQNYLVIVEHGSTAGFKVISEARDFVLSLNEKQLKLSDELAGHVFAPCPHDLECPKFEAKSGPCKFNVTYLTMPFPRVSTYKQETYCYVVLKKGKRPEENNWPRITESIKKRSKHVICQMCTSSGELKTLTISKGKHGRHVYRCAKSCDWGDRFPGHIETEE